MSREKIFAHNLQQARINKGLTQEDVSRVTGYTFVSISRWENGARIPRITVAKVLADIYGVSLDSLFNV